MSKRIEYYEIDTGIVNWNRDLTLEDLLKSEDDIILRIQTNRFDEEIIRKLEDILLKTSNTNVSIQSLSIIYPNSYIYDERDIEKIKKINDFCVAHEIDTRVNLNDSEKSFGGGGTYNQFMIARKEIEDFVEKVNNLTIEENGKQIKLSTAEKFLMAYHFASDRYYNADENNFLSEDMRNWIGLLSTDYAICSGFQSLLKCLCERMFTENELKCFNQDSEVFFKSDGKLAGSHANNLVYLKDEKYGINNVFYCDSCWDCKKENREPNFAYIIPFQQIFNHKGYKFVFHKSSILYDQFNAEVREDVFQERRHETFDNFFLKMFGMKTYDQIKKNYDIDGKIKKAEAESKKQENIIDDLIDEKMAYLLKDDEIAKVLNLTTTIHLPKEFYEKYPFLHEFDKHISKLTLDSSLDKELFKKYYEFYQENKKRFDRAIEKDKNDEFQIFVPLSSIIKHKIYRNEFKFFNSYKYKKTHEKKLKGVIKAQSGRVTEKTKPLFDASELPEELLERVFKAISKLEDIKDENYVQNQMKALKEIKKKNFEANENTDELE